MEVYLVVGTTGSDCSRGNWVVKVYVSKKLAEKHADEAEKRGDEIIDKALGKTSRYGDSFNHDRYGDSFDCVRLDTDYWYDVMAKEKNEFDPDFYCDEYNRATYYSVSGPFEVNTEED